MKKEVPDFKDFHAKIAGKSKEETKEQAEKETKKVLSDIDAFVRSAIKSKDYTEAEVRMLRSTLMDCIQRLRDVKQGTWVREE